MTGTAAPSGSPRAVWYALGANLAIATVKTGGALYTGSGTLFAEALHSVADSGNQALLLWGRHRARKPPSPQHPLGHGREVYFWSFVVALLLFSVGGLLSIYEGVRKLSGNGELREPWLAVAIIGFAFASEAISLRTALREANRLRGGRSLWRWFRDTRRSDLLVVVSEDSAAIVGLAIALTAVVATSLSGNPAYDAAGSIAVGALLVLVALGLAAEIKGLLIGESAPESVQRAIRTALEAQPGVQSVRALITLQHGPDVVVLARLAVAAATLPDLGAAIAACKQALQAAMPEVSQVFVEPDPAAAPTAIRDTDSPAMSFPPSHGPSR